MRVISTRCSSSFTLTPSLDPTVGQACSSDSVGARAAPSPHGAGARLGRTLRAWKNQVLAYFTTAESPTAASPSVATSPPVDRDGPSRSTPQHPALGCGVRPDPTSRQRTPTSAGGTNTEVPPPPVHALEVNADPDQQATPETRLAILAGKRQVPCRGALALLQAGAGTTAETSAGLSLVSVVHVRRRSRACDQEPHTAGQGAANRHGLRFAELESELGACPRGFESRILRS
jgi:hypothetical protein